MWLPLSPEPVGACVCVCACRKALFSHTSLKTVKLAFLVFLKVFS